jgi:hypothetical protein
MPENILFLNGYPANIPGKGLMIVKSVNHLTSIDPISMPEREQQSYQKRSLPDCCFLITVFPETAWMDKPRS